MAVIRTGLVIDQIKGPLSGVSFRVRRGRGSVQLHSGKRSVASAAQVKYRKTFREVVIAWGALSDAQRVDWNDWADAYGTTIDPDAPVEASGRSRFIGANTMQIAGGRSLILSPSSSGIGNAEAGLLAVFPVEGSMLAEVQMLEQYSLPVVSPAWMSVYASPTQRESSPSNKNRWRKVDDIQVTRGGPPGGFPARLIELYESIDVGQMLWIKTKVVTGAGNTSSDATWPVYMPGIGELRAFRIRPVFDFFSPQRYRIEANELVIEFTAATPFDTQLVYDLTDASIDTISELFAQINADGIWQAVNLKAGSGVEPSIDLIDVVNVNVTTGQQPSLLRLPE